MSITPERVRQIDLILDAPRGLTTDRERDLHQACIDLRAELRRRTTQPGRRIPCPYHPDQLAARCHTCREEATPPPAGWRNRGENA